ncbi:MAG: hypothetical protein ACI9C1_000804 [Candidatus Aldehydirespiratoraceae bacterium]|jgi:hypothetical protein
MSRSQPVYATAAAGGAVLIAGFSASVAAMLRRRDRFADRVARAAGRLPKVDTDNVRRTMLKLAEQLALLAHDRARQSTSTGINRGRRISARELLATDPVRRCGLRCGRPCDRRRASAGLCGRDQLGARDGVMGREAGSSALLSGRAGVACRAGAGSLSTASPWTLVARKTIARRLPVFDARSGSPTFTIGFCPTLASSRRPRRGSRVS